MMKMNIPMSCYYWSKNIWPMPYSMPTGPNQLVNAYTSQESTNDDEPRAIAIPSLPSHVELGVSTSTCYRNKKVVERTCLIRVKIRSLNAQIYLPNKFMLNSSKYDFKLEQWRVEDESTWRKVKRLKSEDIYF